jgi:D-arginine dehydrogenase
MTSASGPAIVVIGAGIAGASAAWELAASCTDVTLIELEPQPGLHATGRSAAILSETSGLWEVCALAASSRSFFTAPPEDFVDRPLLCERGLLWVDDDPLSVQRDALINSAQRVGVELETLTPSAAVALVPALRDDWVRTALFEPNAMSIDVARLLDSYISGFRQRGGAIRISTPALALSHEGESWTVDTGTSTIRCDVVVNAAGAWADDVAVRAGLPRLGLQPYRRTAFTFPVDGTQGWPLVMDTANRFYFEPEPPGLLASPSEEIPVDACDAQADELAMAMTVDALAEATHLNVRGVRNSWAGLRTFAPDRLPVVGQDPSATNFYWLAGQGGAGIKTAPALAEGIASMLTARPWPTTLTQLGVTAESLSPARLRA